MMTHQHESCMRHSPPPFGRDFSPLGSVRRAIRRRRIESIVISRRLLVPLTEGERIEADRHITRAV